MRTSGFTRLLALSATSALVLTGCGGDSTAAQSEAEPAASEATDEFPITVEHAFGETEITEAPERVATVAWANHEVPLALGIVPVGMAEANFGDDNGDGVLPWVEERLDELDAETPVLFDETDGIDFEAVADTDPDVILAPYSGLTQEDYDTLSEIAPVVAFPESAWATEWRDVISLGAQGLGMSAAGEELIADLETEIDEAVAEHPNLEGKSTMFLTHVDTTNLSEVNFYTSHDTRTAFFEDLGMTMPASIEEASAETGQFSGTVSAEEVDTFSDVDIIVTYGDEELVDILESDELLSQMPAVANGAIVPLPSDGPIGTASNPTPLAISWVLDDYLDLLDEAAAHSE
ncbi:iron-siderophore ABC transporter substrate-binding protein [Nesterenkonia lutea]|uniref:Iron complex transport system substrate-binding protein n=1 Tax=Nesterenkonia lutea TaxID=272919 RepID=A0ABR9JCG4_9MICC|nr:iron-siderophore ABC transporter substrate-binding protein [Nesterenkonia lutea]MBE1523608.1 iron complex transport system substrate-binding protein [Nesterenkonia lutea]